MNVSSIYPYHRRSGFLANCNAPSSNISMYMRELEELFHVRLSCKLNTKLSTYSLTFGNPLNVVRPDPILEISLVLRSVRITMLLNHGNVGHRPNCFKTAPPMCLTIGNSDIWYEEYFGDYTKEFEDPRKFSDFYNIDIKWHSLCQLSSGKIVEIHSEPFLDFTKLSTWYRKEHPRNVFYWKMHTARLWLQLLLKDSL